MTDRRRTISVSSLSRMFRVLDEPVQLTEKGVVIGTFTPMTMPATRRFGRGVSPYQPEPLKLEMAKLAMETAQALTEIEDLRGLVVPHERIGPRADARHSEYLRRRLYRARLRERQSKEKS